MGTKSFFRAGLTALTLLTISGVQAEDETKAPLFEIVKSGTADDLRIAISSGADANVRNKDGAPILSAAILANQTAMAQQLIEAGADLNATYENYIGANALMLTVGQKNIELARALLDAGADVNQPDTIGDPAINWAAYYGYTDFVKLFLDYGSRTDQRGHGNAREIAMRRGFQDLVLMLARHEKLPVPDPDTAMLVDAIMANDASALEETVSIGVSANSKDFTNRPVLGLAARTSAKTTEILLEGGAQVDAVDEIGFTPLMEAARDGQLTAAQLLIEAGANVNHRALDTGMGLSVIHMAGLSGSPEMVKLIVKAGADINAQGRDGGTALSWSLGNKSMDASIKLLELGADPYLKSKYGDVASYILGSDSEKLAPLKALIEKKPTSN